MKRILFTLALFMSVVALAALFWPKRDSPAPETGGSVLSAAPASGPSQARLPLPPIAKPKPEGVRPEFLSFLKAEAKSLDSPNVNAEDAARRAFDEAQKMGPAEFEFARNTVLSEEAGAGERIMAVFLLTSAGEAGWPALRDIVRSPVSREPFDPHTEAEMKSMQEKAFRLMAIDALAEQAIQSPEARQELMGWLREATDPSIRKTIQAKLDELPPL